MNIVNPTVGNGANGIERLTNGVVNVVGKAKENLSGDGLSQNMTIPPSTVPVGFLEPPANLEHVLRVFDSAAPQSRSIPVNTIGFDIFQFIGDEHPGSDAVYELMRISSNMSCTISYSEDQIGQYAFYRLRWLNLNGEPGPWSDVISGQIMD